MRRSPNVLHLDDVVNVKPVPVRGPGGTMTRTVAVPARIIAFGHDTVTLESPDSAAPLRVPYSALG